MTGRTRNGHGTYTTDKFAVEGEFADDELINGRGTIRFDNGDVWEGEIAAWKPNGRGTISYQVGSGPACVFFLGGGVG